jgi:hypothetical protein
MRKRISSMDFDNKQMTMIYQALIEKKEKLQSMHEAQIGMQAINDDLEQMQAILRRFRKALLLCAF